MTPTTISVVYERKYSDGNYGSEGLMMMISLPVEDSESAKDALHIYAVLLRHQVLEELAKSPAPRVARIAAQELDPHARVVAAIDNSDDPEDLPF